MQLNSDWKYIVKKAWSFKLLVLAGVFTSIELVLPLFANDIPRGLFTVLTLISVTSGMIARVVAQKGLK